MRHGRATVKVAPDLAPCLHPDARAWIMDWYRMPIEATLDDETLVLFGAPDDAELGAFLVALTRYAEHNRGTAGAPVAVLHDGRRYTLRAVDAVRAGKTKRVRPTSTKAPAVAFDPAGALLDRVAGRRPRHGGEGEED